MSLRKLFLFSMVAALCLGRPASSQEHRIKVGAGAIAEVFDGKSPSVQVTNAEGKILTTIPLEYDAGKFIYAQPVNTLYVVHSEKRSENYVSVVNLTTNQVEREIRIGDGPVVELFVSNGGHRLFCYTAGSPSLFGYSYKPPFEPAVTAIDTAANKVIAKYNLFDSFREIVRGKTQIEINLNYFQANDRGDLVVKTQAFWIKQKQMLGERFWVFSDKSPQPASMIDPHGEVTAMMLSRDKKYFFAAIDGDIKAGGSILAIDLETGAFVTHSLNDQPTNLVRFGSHQELWLLGSEEMRFLAENGELGDRRIPLNRPGKPETGGNNSASAFFDGLPGEAISLGDDHAAIQINDKNGDSLHKVALIDLKKLQVQAILPTIGANETAGVRPGRFLVAFGVSLATGGTVNLLPDLAVGNETLEARTDGQALFALDQEGHEVTVVDVQTATVVKRISVNNTVAKIQLSPDGKHLLCVGNKTQQINLETNNLEN